jgi:hypothetical protein
MQQIFVYYEVTLTTALAFFSRRSFSVLRQVDFKRNRKDVCIGAAGMQVDTFVRVEADRFFFFEDFGDFISI